MFLIVLSFQRNLDNLSYIKGTTMITIDPIRKLDTISIVRYNNDKVSFPFPESFIEAHQLQPKDEMEVYRDRVNGYDALIIIPKTQTVNSLRPESSMATV